MSVGPLTDETPVERCENSSADTLVYEGSCYTRITVNEANLDRATLTCNEYYNGTLYELDNTTVNARLNGMFGDIIIVYPDEYSRFTPQDGYFNLYTSIDGSNYTESPSCVRVYSDGSLSDSVGCPFTDVDYICRRG